jgi:hypothetical protein
MPLPIDVLASELLQLSAPERARLLSQVILSLETDAERDARWATLAAQRDAEADADAAALVPSAEALARLRDAAA